MPTVTSLPATDGAVPATAPVVALRADLAVSAGTYVYDGDHLVTGWHRHDQHQLEYAVAGLVEVETPAGRYLLPPQQAAWIPAGLPHTTTLHSRVRTIAVLLDPALVPDAGDRVRILPVGPLVRELVLHAARWRIDRAASDPLADSCFGTLALLLHDTLGEESPLSLPSSDDPLVAAAMQHALDHLSTVDLAATCRALGVSERTLRRRFTETTSVTWRDYVLQARVLRAMTLLAQPRSSVEETARAVGFSDVGAFSRSFRRQCGDTPSAYRRRVQEDGRD